MKTCRSNTRLQRLHRAAALVMLIPFLALSLLSQSVMATQIGDGTVKMVLCTGDGLVEMTVDLGIDQPPAHEPCDWSNVHGAALLATVFVTPIHAQTYLRAQARSDSALWHSAYDPRNLWARGPPTLV